MTDATYWWLLAGAAVAIEMFTGTFYLLMLALGLASGALAAHLGAPLTLQLVTAACMGGGAVAVWYQVQKKKSAAQKVISQREASMDIGQSVDVDHWHANGTAQVKYRGSSWTAIHAQGAQPSQGVHRIVDIQGSQLVLDKIQP
jgi:membrane protein implicated in regulation of membrane protease activity